MEQRVRKCSKPMDLSGLELVEKRCPQCGGRFKTLAGSDQRYDNVMCLVKGEYGGEAWQDPATGVIHERPKVGRPRKLVWTDET